jgi:hypothetical protein
MRSMRLRHAAASVSLLVAAACGSAFAAGAGAAAASSHGPGGGGGQVWIQTMDSCKQALGGAAYVVGGGGVSITVTDASPGAGSVGISAGCPLQQGNCAAGRGCASFAAPGPGTYTIRQTATPPGNATNPEGYAPCEGGSACRSEAATLTVGSGGGVSATVTAVYPDGTTVTWPSTGSYAGTPSDPIVFHDFGLAAPGSAHNGQCDGDSDADDHLTGTPSSHCAYPEAQESSACQPFPWSCQFGTGTPGSVPQAHRPGGGSSSGSSSGGGHSAAGSSGGGVRPSASGGGSSHTASARSIRSS